MPWKETDAVNERTRFVVLYTEGAEEEEPNLSELCRRFGITRPTGYKWLERFKAGGLLALMDQSRARREVQNRTAPWIEDAVVLQRKKRPTWGPAKLLFALEKARPDVEWPSPSTVGEILKRKGLIRPRRRRIRTEWMGGTLEGARGPNDVWAVDFKGHFAMRDGKRCHPLTVTDLCSRYLIQCAGLEREGVDLVQPQLELAFQEFGIPNRLRSDNGPPFSSLAAGGLCPLAVWLIQLGITPERIRPSSPQENGSHERMHRTLKAEATRPPQQGMAEQQRAFDDFRAIFNRDRPHEALGQRPPATLYASSERPFPAQLKHPEYPAGFDVRRTNHLGQFSFRNTKLRTSKALVRTQVGLQPVDEDRWQLFYGPLSFGFIDARKEVRILRCKPESWSAPPLASLAPAGDHQQQPQIPSTSRSESVNHVPG